MASSHQHFTNTFILSSISNAQQILSEIPQTRAADLSRQRRGHRKSKLGCDNCRKRHVKCNEEAPCANCTRRGERCSRIISVSTTVTQLVSPYSEATNAEVNLFRLKLFHHFQANTQQTLMHGPEVWDHALQLSFHFDFLMNTILCVAARHLAFLQPTNAKYPRAASSNLCHALSGFRKELSKDFVSVTLDAFIATSTLLQYEVWSCADFCAPRDDGAAAFDPSKDPIFGLSAGLKQVFLKAVPCALDQPSVFMPYIRLDPTDALALAANIGHDTWVEYQDLFSTKHPLTSKPLGILPYIRDEGPAISSLWKEHFPSKNNASCPVEDGYEQVITRICLILSFLPEAQPPAPIDAGSPLMRELARSVFSFPMLCRGPFAAMVRQSDSHALLLLYHFYRAVRILLPSAECWWAHERATISEKVLRRWLLWKGAKPI